MTIKSFSKALKIVVALLLVMSMVFEWIPPTLINAIDIIESDQSSEIDGSPADNVFIQLNGQRVDSISMNFDEKAALTIETTISNVSEYRWEILVDKNKNTWVPIYGQNNVNIDVTYAMLASFLDENNLAQIRAAVISGEDKFISGRLLIEVKEEEIPSAEDYYINLDGISMYSVMSIGDEIDTYAEVDENAETRTLRINYLRSTGEQVCDPYIATVYEGMPFNTTVLSPSVIGYEPRFSEDPDDTADSYTFEEYSVTEDIEINIYYYPIKVKYEVRYYMQGIYDDNYTMYGDPEIAYGLVGTEPDPTLLYKTFDGYVKVNHYPEVIAADGSTVFQCFYDRKYCLVNLDLNGGHGVDSVYAKYGTAFIVNTPEKPGYIFAGWDGNGDGAADDLPATVPMSNVSYMALWRTTNTTYTVVYWNNVSGGKSEYLASAKVAAVSGSKVSGTNNLSTAQICGKEEHEHSESDGCYSCNDTGCEHTTAACYTANYNKVYVASTQTGNTKTAYERIVQLVGNNAKNGYVYRCTRSQYSSIAYNFFYLDSTWYFLGTGNEYRDVISSMSSPTTNNYVEAQAVVDNCSNTHTHSNGCVSCDKEVHSHNSSCSLAETIDTSRFDFETADSNVIVNGDGSTVVNVYYKYKEYTLKFYYAKEEDGKYYVCGNSTQFANGDGIVNQLTNVKDQWGEVKEMPTLFSNGVVDVSKYTYGFDEYTINNKTGKYYYIQFTAPYNADISTMWPVGIFNAAETARTFDYGNYAYFSAWNVDSGSWYDNQYSNKTLKGNYQRLDYKMLMDNDPNQTTINFLGFWENGTTGLGWNKPHKWNYNVYVPILSTTTTYDKEYNGIKYKLYGTYVVYDNNTSSLNSIYCDQTPTALEGFEISHYNAYKIETYDTTYNLEIHQIDFYYTRNSDYTLTIYNHGELEEDKGKTGLSFEEDLSDYYYVPSYPSTLEPNAYRFDGWYTTAGGYDGTEVDFENLTMPASNLVIYSKWVPVTHTVTFYNTYQDMTGGGASLKTVSVPHGNTLSSNDVPKTENEGYTAGEWFYIKNGEKVAYQPLSIAVKEDLQVYREWSSSTVVEYTAHYYKIGTTEKVADSTTGWMFEGMTKTFKAKGGGDLGELYADYTDGWYPTVSSSSIVASADSDNTVIFYYDYQNPNPYTVRYIDSTTNLEIATSKVVLNNVQSVVTEVYRPIDGYIPDAYYKQLVLAINKDQDPDLNTITFYYNKATDSAYYAVEYYFMNVDGTTYSLNAKIQSPIAVGSAASIPDVSTAGFTLQKCSYRDGDDQTFHELSGSGLVDSMNNIKVGESGALIQVYYERAKTSYTVHYYVENSTQSLKPDRFASDIYFGTTITEYAGEAVEGYTLISDTQQTKELLLNADQNIFAFYYEEKLKTAEYKPVIRDQRFVDGIEEMQTYVGFVTITKDVKRWSQPYDNVTATARPGFYFAGWYLDQECTNLVTENRELTPTGNDDIVYYALFEPYYTDLTLTNSITSTDVEQNFVFRIVGTDVTTDHIDLTVTLGSNDLVKICHIPLGNYQITEITDWSWDHSVVGETIRTITVDMDSTKNVVQFYNAIDDIAWLRGNTYDHNNFN